jgi:hypothetical protein
VRYEALRRAVVTSSLRAGMKRVTKEREIPERLPRALPELSRQIDILGCLHRQLLPEKLRRCRLVLLIQILVT